VIGIFHGGLGNVRKSAPGRFFALGGCRDGPRDSQKHGLNGVFGVLLFKDFGSVLDLRHEQRADMMAALRRIFDGEYTRHVGSRAAGR
jgi:hypothetical protein